MDSLQDVNLKYAEDISKQFSSYVFLQIAIVCLYVLPCYESILHLFDTFINNIWATDGANLL